MTNPLDPVDLLTPDALRDEPWARVLPWLAEHAAGSVDTLVALSPAADWWLTESPAVSSTVTPLSQIRQALSELIVTTRPTSPLRELLPGLPDTTPTAVLRVGTRAMTALARVPASTVGELAEKSVEELFAIRGTGAGTVHELVGALVTLVVLNRPTTEGAASGVVGLHETPREPGEELGPVERQLLDDLRRLARWRRVRGDTSDGLLGDCVVEDTAPEEIQDVATRLRAVTATDVLAVGPPADPFVELAELTAAFTERQLMVIRRRIVAYTPETLAEIAQDFGVSRERVRQIESSVRERMAAAFVFGTAVGDLLASLRVDIQPVSSLDRLVGRHPELADEVPGLGVPLWLVLDRLDDYFEVSDGWAASPTVSQAREKTIALLGDVSSEEGTVPLQLVESLTTLARDDLEPWMVSCGLPVMGNAVLTRTATAGDHAAGILSVEGQPLDVTEIRRRMHPPRSLGTLTNALGADDRFVRTDRTTWALARWQVDAYTSIRQMVGIAVDGAGGRIELATLVSDLTSRFTVAPSSIHAYATAGEFEVLDGFVRRRESAASTRRSPADTRRLHRHGSEWCYRVRVTSEHLRGSGFTLPTGVAAVVSCGVGDTVELPSRLGHQTVRWTGHQPASGTVRRFLDDLGVQEDDDVFLVYTDTGRFDVRRAATHDGVPDPLAAALALVGADPAVCLDGSQNDPTSVLAAAAGLDRDAKPRRVLSAYRRRGDQEVAELLERVWVRLPNATPDLA